MNNMFETTQLSALFNELAKKKDYRQLVYVSERMYGTGGFGNSLAMCLCIEGVSEVIPPSRADYIRTVFMELSLAQENLLRLASITEYLGFENMSMMCWSYREDFLEIIDKLTGNRMFASICKAGGVRCDFDSKILDQVSLKLQGNLPGLEKIKSNFKSDGRIGKRLKNVGILSKEDAEAASVTGPAAKGSGIAIDRRSLGEYGAYDKLNYSPVVEEDGDCFARCLVKIREVIQSTELIIEAIKSLPAGDIASDVPDKLNGQWITKIEQADGADTYYIKGENSAYLKEVGIRKAAESNEKIMDRVTDYKAEDESLVRLTLGLDECLDER